MKHSFSHLPKIEDPLDYVSFALSKTNKQVGQLTVRGSLLEKTHKREVERLIRIRDQLLSYLDKIHNAWPSLDALPEFYIRLFELTLSIDELKHALGAIGFATNTIKKLTLDHIRLVKNSQTPQEAKKHVGAFLGRTQSVFKKIAKKLAYLEKARTIARTFPSLDPELFTIAIAGFPNIGKSTLLKKVTGANPEIKDYAFTTKGLNTGYLEYKFSQLQFVDTPGVLGRNKENMIEQFATITRRYVANIVVYVFDLTEPYPLKDQQELYEQTVAEGQPVIIYMSKTDLLTKEQVDEFVKQYERAHTSTDSLLQEIKKEFSNWM